MNVTPLFAEQPSVELIETYLTLTTKTLPYMAQEPHRRWPIKYDHCFQRVVLDNICQGV